MRDKRSMITHSKNNKNLIAGIAKVEGVISYETSYQKANCIVKFDNTKTSVDSIAKAIHSIGYKVTSLSVQFYK